MLVSERREYPSSSPGGSLAFGAAARVVVIAAGKLPEEKWSQPRHGARSRTSRAQVLTRHSL